MKIALNRSELAEAATWVSGAIPKNPDSPPMAGMLLEVQDGLVSLTGYDRDTLRQSVVAGESTAKGSILVSGKFLTQIVSALKGDVVTLELADNRLAVTAGRSTYRARTMDPADYPSLPQFPAHVGTIAADSLVDVLGTVEHAVGKDAPLAVLNAYNIVGDAGNLTVTSTDRFRLATATVRWADASGTTFEANVPGVALTTAVKSFRGDVQIGASSGLFGLSDAGRVIITRVLGSEDKFPKTAPIFAKEPLVTVRADVAPLAEALKRSQLVADDTGMIQVLFSDGLIRVIGDGEGSDGVEEIDCETGFGEGELGMKFSAQYLSQAILASPSPRVTFGLIDERSQALIKPDGIESIAMIVMPRGLGK